MEQNIETLNIDQMALLLYGYHHIESLKKVFGENFKISVAGNVKPLINQRRIHSLTPRVAIVGTRDLKANEIPIVKRIVQALAQNTTKPIIISGLAMGTDTVVHQTALECGLPTYAVMPCGLDTVYPMQNKSLAGKMIDSGLRGGGLITAFPNGTAPMAINFIQRNHIIAAMADVLIVPFSKKKGGAMVTARLFREYGHYVYALPGRPDDINSQGCNLLIEEGAQIITDIEKLKYLSI